MAAREDRTRKEPERETSTLGRDKQKHSSLGPTRSRIWIFFQVFLVYSITLMLANTQNPLLFYFPLVADPPKQFGNLLLQLSFQLLKRQRSSFCSKGFQFQKDTCTNQNGSNLIRAMTNFFFLFFLILIYVFNALCEQICIVKCTVTSISSTARVFAHGPIWCFSGMFSCDIN